MASNKITPPIVLSCNTSAVTKKKTFYNMKLSPYHVLLIVSFLDTLSAGLLMPQLAGHVNGLGGNHIVIGMMGAIYSASQLISGPVIGSLSDLKGRKPILLLCLSVCGVTYFILGLTSSVFIFLVLRGILGLMKQTQLLSKALAPDHVKDVNNQSVLYGRLASLSGVGMSIGPIIGGHIMEANPDYGFTIITTIMLGLFAVNLGLINTLPEITSKEKKYKKPAKQISAIAPKLIDSLKGPLKDSINEFYKIDWPNYGDIFLYKLLMTLSMGMYFTNFGLFLKTIHTVSPKNLGYIISLQGVTGSLCTYFIGHVNKLYQSDKDYSERNYHVFIIVATTLFSLALAPNVYIYTALLIPLAIASSVARIVSLEMVTSRTSGDHRGTVIGASNSVRSLSGVVIPVVAGMINQYIGVVCTFYCAASFAAVGVVLSRRIRLTSIEAKDK